VRVTGIKNIKNTFDFYESIILDISIDENFLDTKIKLLYFFDNPIGCKDKEIVITCHNCIKTSFNMAKALFAVKVGKQDKIYADVMEFIIEEGDLIHIKIRNNFNETMIDIICEDMWIDY